MSRPALDPAAAVLRTIEVEHARPVGRIDMNLARLAVVALQGQPATAVRVQRPRHLDPFANHLGNEPLQPFDLDMLDRIAARIGTRHAVVETERARSKRLGIGKEVVID